MKSYRRRVKVKVRLQFSRQTLPSAVPPPAYFHSILLGTRSELWSSRSGRKSGALSSPFTFLFQPIVPSWIIAYQLYMRAEGRGRFMRNVETERGGHQIRFKCGSEGGREKRDTVNGREGGREENGLMASAHPPFLLQFLQSGPYIVHEPERRKGLGEGRGGEATL